MLGDLSKEVVAGARVAEIVKHISAVEGERRLSPRNSSALIARGARTAPSGAEVAPEGAIVQPPSERRPSLVEGDVDAWSSRPSHR